MIRDPLFILAVLAINVAACEWVVRVTWLRHLGSALLVIVLTAIVANLGLIPTVGDGSPVYDGTFRFLAPLAIFWLLLQVNLRSLRRAGLPMILWFLLGAVGTVVGVLVALKIVDGAEAFGEWYPALGGMFVGTYIGGSINFNAVALEYGVAGNGLLYAGASVVDSAMTTVWMAATVILPRLVRRPGASAAPDAAVAARVGEARDDAEQGRESVHPVELSALIALGAGALWISERLSALLAGSGIPVPSILILTTLALLLAQWEPVRRLRGGRVLGWTSVMFFLAVIGALCDVGALASIGRLGWDLSVFVVVVVLVHGTIVFLPTLFGHGDPAIAAVASQANVGGGTSALALARSLGRDDLVLPAVLVGSLGNGLGTYLGFLVAAWLS